MPHFFSFLSITHHKMNDSQNSWQTDFQQLSLQDMSRNVNHLFFFLCKITTKTLNYNSQGKMILTFNTLFSIKLNIKMTIYKQPMKTLSPFDTETRFAPQLHRFPEILQCLLQILVISVRRSSIVHRYQELPVHIHTQQLYQ